MCNTARQFSVLSLLLSIAVLMASIAGCTAGNPDPPETDTALAELADAEAQVQGFQPVLTGIPFPAEPASGRLTSVPKNHLYNGQDEWIHGPGSHDVSAPFLAHRLPAGPGELEWAIYRLGTGGYPVLEVSVIVQVLQGEYYVGIASYSTMAWQFSGALTDISHTQNVHTHNVSPGGFVYVAVAAYDIATIDVRNLNLVTDEPGWVTVTVDSFPAPVNGVQLFPGDQNELPRIGVILDHVVLYYSTFTRTPDASTTWESIIADSTSGEAQFYRPFEATFVDWNPAMVYYRHNGNYQLQYTYAETGYPEVDDWVTVNVGDAVLLPGTGAGLCEYRDLPAIVFPGTGPDDIMLALSDTAAPLAADWDVSLVYEDARRPSICVINDTLNCSFLTSGESSMLIFARALVDAPDGPGGWATMEARGPLGTNYSMLTEIIGAPHVGDVKAPLIAFVKTATDNPHVLSSTSPEPAAFDDWYHTELNAVNEVATYKLDLQLISGTPALVYFLDDVGKLQFGWSATPRPDDDGDWDITTLVNSPDIGQVALGSYLRVPAVAYFDRATGKLMYSYFEEP